MLQDVVVLFLADGPGAGRPRHEVGGTGEGVAVLAIGGTGWRNGRVHFAALDRDVPRFLADFEAAYARVDRSRFANATSHIAGFRPYRSTNRST